MRVHLSGRWLDNAKDVLRQADGVELTFGDEPHDDAAILVSGGASAEQLATLGQLRAIVVPWAGPGEGIRAAAKARGVSLHNLHGNAAATAEQAMALLLGACRLVPRMDAATRTGHWPGRSPDAPDLQSQMIVLDGKRAVLLGFGEIGRRIGRMLEGFGVAVTGVTRTGRDGTTRIEQLHDVLPSAELLISSLPLTEATKGLIGEREIALLPGDAVVVNVGRGAVFEEAALFEALRSGRLKSAGLDVWWTYPKDGKVERNVAWETLENVVMSPHIGGAGAAAGQRERRAAALAELLTKLARGERVNEVDLEAGY